MPFSERTAQGKSTLIKIITGVYRPDGGGLLLDNEAVEFAGPRDAIAHHIGVVHQERNLIPRFSIGENIFLEQLGAFPFRPIDYRSINDRAREWLRMLDLDIDPSTPVSELSVARMQLVEIAKALALRSRILLLDEPTASLTEHETVVLFRLLAAIERRRREPPVRQPQTRGSAGNLRSRHCPARWQECLRKPADGGSRPAGSRQADDRSERTDRRLVVPRFSATLPSPWS